MDQFFEQSPVIIDDEDPEDQFELQDLIGQGAYGSVYKAQHKKSGQYAAVKIVPSSEEIQSLQKETQILKDCKSSYIVKYYGSFYKNANLWLIMEYCAAGSVIDLLKITKKKLGEEEIAAILFFALKGIEYLHANKKIHRDIKAGNILLDHYGNAKLADFGVSAQLLYTNADKETFIGTPFWMSPEVISKHKYNNLTDIWSLGVTAIELAEGQPPLSHMHPVRAMFVIRNNPPKGLTDPSKWSADFVTFVQSCLKVEVSERPTASQLLQSKFIQLGQREVGRLKKLVEESLNQIEEYRITKQNSQQNFQDSIKSKSIGSNPQTMVRKDSSESEKTAIEVDTIVIKNGTNQEPEEHKELDFVSYAKKLQMVEEFESQERQLVEDVSQIQLKTQEDEEEENDEQYGDEDDEEEEEEEEKYVEKEIEKMNASELERFLDYLLNKMDNDIQKVKEKYKPKIEDLKKRINLKRQQTGDGKRVEKQEKIDKIQDKQLKRGPQQLQLEKQLDAQEKVENNRQQQVKQEKQDQESAKQDQFWSQLRQQQDPSYIQYKRSEKLESNLQQIINLPFNFQVNQELLNKLSNIKIPELKLQGVSPSSQLRSNPKKLPFEFIPSVKKH